jgi:hypothetical protein
MSLFDFGAQEGVLGTISEEAKAIISHLFVTECRSEQLFDFPEEAPTRMHMRHSRYEALAAVVAVAAASPASALLVPRSACVEGLHPCERVLACSPHASGWLAGGGQPPWGGCEDHLYLADSHGMDGPPHQAAQHVPPLWATRRSRVPLCLPCCSPML